MRLNVFQSAGTVGTLCGTLTILAVAFPPESVHGAEVIVDNTDAGFTVLSGTWSTTSASGQYGNDYRNKETSNTVTGEVEWRPSLSEAGSYTVSVWYRSSGGLQPNNARYTVHHDGGTDNVYVNQQINGSQWVSLGTYTFAAGSSGRVTLTNQAQKNKTIVADAVKFDAPSPEGPEFRGFWADVFRAGFRNASEVDEMISLALAGNYNAIVPEVLAYHDNQPGSHGAFWRSNIVPRSTYVTSSFDPLGYMVEQAHANGLEVHPWVVAYRVSTVWPPAGNAYLAARPHWLMVPSGSMGSVAPVGSAYTLDPGSPEVQEYLTSIMREIVTDYDVDGFHWDYIRYTQSDAGYPADTSYTGSSLARFKAITGYSGTPSTSYGPWNDFRRRTITELVRRVRAEIPTITSNPRQPVRYTAALVTWYPAATDFHQTGAYARFCDWEFWMSQGYLDASIPMAYFDEDGSYASTYYGWVDNSIGWRYDRHTFIGPGIYMNSFANSVKQIEYARAAGADGICTYSYGVTSDTSDPWRDWYPYVRNNVFTQPADIPGMPWRHPATATEGTLFGRVVDSLGQAVDDATVEAGSLNPVQTDGNGYYVVTLIPAAGGGTSYTVTAEHPAFTWPAERQVTVLPGDVVRRDLILGDGPEILAHPQAQLECGGQTASFSITATGSGSLIYQWRKDGSDLSEGPDVQGATTSSLTILNVDAGASGYYSCLVIDDNGGTLSNDASLTLKAQTAITQHPQPQVPMEGETASFTVAGTGSGALTYQWQKDGVDLEDGGKVSGTATPELQVQSVDLSDEGEYRCVVTAECGSATSASALLSLLRPPGDFDGDMDVDMDDYAFLQACFSGTLIPQNSPDCEAAKLDDDLDVDAADLAIFLGCMSGANVPANFDCAN